MVSKVLGSGTIILILVISTLTLAVNTQSVKAGTITVPDDYLSIQEAINHANEGDTVFVRAGTYYEHVVINKTVSLIGENRETTTIDGNGTGTVLWVGKDAQQTANVTIKDLSIKNGQYGVRFEYTSNSTMAESIIDNQFYGILAEGAGSVNNAISKNIIRNCRSSGIELVDTVNTEVEYNTIVDTSLYGLITQSCSECSIIGNNVSRAFGIKLISSTNMKVLGNRVYDIPGADGVQLFESDFNTVEGNLVEECAVGVFLHGAYNLIRCNEFVSNFEGILINASNNTIYHNDFVHNYYQFNNLRDPRDAPIKYTNFWDNGYEGNYWSDYDGTDTNGDGVGDTDLPYPDGRLDIGIDYHPLISPYSFWDWFPCDFNHDLRIDIKDVAYAAKSYGSYPSDPRWNPRVDLNNDGRIDIKDLALIAVNYGRAYP